MKFIPILFSTEMVQAILDSRKTMTRRVVKLQPGEGECYQHMGGGEFAYISHGGLSAPYICPYGHPGDVLWVREAINIGQNGGIHYRADELGPLTDVKWRTSIHMPKAACRLFLKVKSVRVERLQDISEEDAIAEGVKQIADYGSTGYKLYTDPNVAHADIDAVWSFESLWESINGPGSWEANPGSDKLAREVEGES